MSEARTRADALLEAGQWDRMAREAEQHGDLLRAYDFASRGLVEHPDDVILRYRAVLNLSRSGAHDQAAALYAQYRLSTSDDEHVAALGARLLRERALAATGPEAAALLTEAAVGYAHVYRRTRGTFPGINAACLYLFAGAADEARALAREILATCVAAGITSYDLAADAAAAALILGETTAAEDFVGQCKALSGGHYVWVAQTRRQLGRICDTLGRDRAVLAPLRARMVIHYTGHMIAAPGQDGRFPAEAEAHVAGQIGDYIRAHEVGFGFGSLACGADILVAQALLKERAELNLVLPFGISEFRDYSVARRGDGWVERFDECIANASGVTYATNDGYLGDRVLFGHAGRLAMGLAVLRAGHVDAPVKQLAIWDGESGLPDAGTAADVAAWRSHGLSTDVIDSCPSAVRPPPPAQSPGEVPGRPKRVIKAMLFGDAKGFSKLPEAAIPAFVDHFLGALARVLDRYKDRIEFRNTWGDGLYVVMSDVHGAMECALDLQAEIAKLDHAALGLRPDLKLRLSGHAGPVFPMTDPVLGVPVFMGSHVSRTSRMEKVTPEGEVYVTEAFAALVALDQDPTLSCEYVGILPADKDYGSFRMYVLKRRPAAEGHRRG